MSAPSTTAARAARTVKPARVRPFLSIALARKVADIVTEACAPRVMPASVEASDRCMLHLAHALTCESPGETGLLVSSLITFAAAIADIESFETVEGHYASYVVQLATLGAKLVQLAAMATRAEKAAKGAGQ